MRNQRPRTCLKTSKLSGMQVRLIHAGNVSSTGGGVLLITPELVSQCDDDCTWREVSNEDRVK